MKKKRIVTRILAMAVACTLLMGITASAELVPKSADYLSIYDVGGTRADAVTNPRNVHKFYIGYAYKYNCKLVVNCTTKPKECVKIAKFTEKIKGVDFIGYKMWATKPGNATVTVTFTDSSGLKKTNTQKIRTYKWSNPFKTLKIGKKNFKSAFKSSGRKNITPVSGKLSIKMNSRFKKLKVYYMPKGSSSRKQVSVSGRVSLKKGDTLIFQFTDYKNRVKNVEAAFIVK